MAAPVDKSQPDNRGSDTTVSTAHTYKVDISLCDVLCSRGLLTLCCGEVAGLPSAGQARGNSWLINTKWSLVWSHKVQSCVAVLQNRLQ